MRFKKLIVDFSMACISCVLVFHTVAMANGAGNQNAGNKSSQEPAASKEQLVMIGDSITDNLRKSEPPLRDFQPIWKQYYEPYHTVNFGVSGFKTSDVIRKIQGGMLDHVRPKVVMLLIGTNDTGTGSTVEQTVQGITEVVKLIHEKLPSSRILVLGILPNNIRDWHVAGAKNPAAKWAADRQVNRQVKSKLRNARYVTFLDMEKRFLNRDGSVNENLFYDPWEVNFLGRKCGPLHPNTQGVKCMAEVIEPVLKKLMNAPAL